MDKAGNLYGTTGVGGSGGDGVVFKLDTAGKETVLHSFIYSDGANPLARLIMDRRGNLYGTTAIGGSSIGGSSVKELCSSSIRMAMRPCCIALRTRPMELLLSQV